MKFLPNYQNAYIDKLKEYCLNENHPVGKHKAFVFKAALGISSDNAEELKSQIIENIAKSDISEGEKDNLAGDISLILKLN